MPHKPAKLTDMENEILKRLAMGWGFEAIRRDITLERYPQQPLTKEYFYVITSKIRKKTGIQSTRDKRECENYRNQVQPLYRHKAKYPTHQQIRAMRLRAQGLSNEEAGKIMGVRWDTVMNHITVGCRRAGIPRFQGHDRTRQIQLWLDKHDAEAAELKAYIMARPRVYAPGEGPGLLAQVVEHREREAEQREAEALTMDDF